MRTPNTPRHQTQHSTTVGVRITRKSRSWIDAGKLPAVRVGRRVRVHHQDFEALIDQGPDPPARRAGSEYLGARDPGVGVADRGRVGSRRNYKGPASPGPAARFKSPPSELASRAHNADPAYCATDNGPIGLGMNTQLT